MHHGVTNTSNSPQGQKVDYSHTAANISPDLRTVSSLHMWNLPTQDPHSLSHMDSETLNQFPKLSIGKKSKGFYEPAGCGISHSNMASEFPNIQTRPQPGRRRTPGPVRRHAQLLSQMDRLKCTNSTAQQSASVGNANILSDLSHGQANPKETKKRKGGCKDECGTA